MTKIWQEEIQSKHDSNSVTQDSTWVIQTG